MCGDFIDAEYILFDRNRKILGMMIHGGGIIVVRPTPPSQVSPIPIHL